MRWSASKARRPTTVVGGGPPAAGAQGPARRRSAPRSVARPRALEPSGVRRRRGGLRRQQSRRRYSSPTARKAASRRTSRHDDVPLRWTGPSYSPTTPASSSSRSGVPMCRPSRSNTGRLQSGRGSSASSTQASRSERSPAVTSCSRRPTPAASRIADAGPARCAPVDVPDAARRAETRSAYIAMSATIDRRADARRRTSSRTSPTAAATGAPADRRRRSARSGSSRSCADPDPGLRPDVAAHGGQVDRAADAAIRGARRRTSSAPSQRRAAQPVTPADPRQDRTRPRRSAARPRRRRRRGGRTCLGWYGATAARAACLRVGPSIPRGSDRSGHASGVTSEAAVRAPAGDGRRSSGTTRPACAVAGVALGASTGPAGSP